MNTEPDCANEKEPGIRVMQEATGCLTVKPASEVSAGHIGDFVSVLCKTL